MVCPRWWYQTFLKPTYLYIASNFQDLLELPDQTQQLPQRRLLQPSAPAYNPLQNHYENRPSLGHIEMQNDSRFVNSSMIDIDGGEPIVETTATIDAQPIVQGIVVKNDAI